MTTTWSMRACSGCGLAMAGPATTNPSAAGTAAARATIDRRRSRTFIDTSDSAWADLGSVAVRSRPHDGFEANDSVLAVSISSRLPRFVERQVRSAGQPVAQAGRPGHRTGHAGEDGLGRADHGHLPPGPGDGRVERLP